MSKVVTAIKRPKQTRFVRIDGPDSINELKAIGAKIELLTPGTWRVYNRVHNSHISFKTGDYICIENYGDFYPVDAEVFAETYEVVK